MGQALAFLCRWAGRARPLALAALVLFVVELGLGLLPVPRQRLETILELFDLHPTRIWMLRRHLATRFEGGMLHTDEHGWRTCPEPGSSPRFTVCCLGDSLTFGWGVDDDAPWPARLAIDHGLRVHNLSVPGYSSWQGLDVVEHEVTALRPDVVVLAYGVNDVSRLRFFGSNLLPDSQQSAFSPWEVAGWNLAMGTNTYRFLRNETFRRRGSSTEARGRVLRWFEQAPPRVAAEEYAQNVERMIGRCRSRGALVVLLRLPLHLPLPPLVTPSARAQANLHFRQASSLQGRGEHAGALASFLAGLEADPLDRSRCWEALREAREIGDTGASARILALMQKQEVYDSSQRHGAYNQLLDSLAARAAVPLADAERDLADAGSCPDAWYNDPVRDPYHPNGQGHRIIAACVARTLRTMHPQKMK